MYNIKSRATWIIAWNNNFIERLSDILEKRGAMKSPPKLTRSYFMTVDQLSVLGDYLNRYCIKNQNFSVSTLKSSAS